MHITPNVYLEKEPTIILTNEEQKVFKLVHDNFKKWKWSGGFSSYSTIQENYKFTVTSSIKMDYQTYIHPPPKEYRLRVADETAVFYDFEVPEYLYNKIKEQAEKQLKTKVKKKQKKFMKDVFGK